jgi:hypothetical protein
LTETAVVLLFLLLRRGSLALFSFFMDWENKKDKEVLLGRCGTVGLYYTLYVFSSRTLFEHVRAKTCKVVSPLAFFLFLFNNCNFFNGATLRKGNSENTKASLAENGQPKKPQLGHAWTELMLNYLIINIFGQLWAIVIYEYNTYKTEGGWREKLSCLDAG